MNICLRLLLNEVNKLVLQFLLLSAIGSRKQLWQELRMVLVLPVDMH
jgi:hypothetical protein